jgi:site-specific DNA-cytosine methylase
VGRLTHASFFSGAGGTDLGLEAAGFETVSFSEIEPYACAVLAERWPGVLNLGSIVDLAMDAGRESAAAARSNDGGEGDPAGLGQQPRVDHDSGRDGSPDADGASGLLREPVRGLHGQDGRSDQREPVAASGDAGAGGRVHPSARDAGRVWGGIEGSQRARDSWAGADLWSGGFPCQDLSVAGKRRGFTGDRSVLAFAFLDLVERHRPRAILLENVPGLLSSNSGRDMAALLSRVVELGYGVAFRTLDARLFGVPQRRRRVFILALRGEADDADGRAAAERAAAILSVGAFCRRHPPTGEQEGPRAAAGAQRGADESGGAVGAVTANGNGGASGQDANTGQVFVDPGLGRAAGDERLLDAEQFAYVGESRDERDSSDADDERQPEQGWDERSAGPDRADGPTPDADRVRAADGLAGRSHGGQGLEQQGQEQSAQPGASGVSGPLEGGREYVGALRSHVRPESNSDQTVFVKAARAQTADDDESWVEGEVAPTLNSFDSGDVRSTALVAADVGNHHQRDRVYADEAPALDAHSGEDELADLLPAGLDSNRYRCCGNGVVAPVAEWIGRRIAAALTVEGD